MKNKNNIKKRENVRKWPFFSLCVSLAVNQWNVHTNFLTLLGKGSFNTDKSRL